MNRFAITADPLNAEAIVASVASPRCGAVATFIGLVRDHNAGRRVEWLDYEAYPALAVKTFERIGAEAAERWPSVALAIHHRVGPDRDWRGERGHRRGLAAPGGRVCGVPVRDRAGQTDRAGVEARALRRRRRLDRGRHGRSG